MKMEPKIVDIITPQPYFIIKFGCTNRQFYNVKNDLYNIADNIGIEAGDGYFDESCDYEGDLEEIRVYRCERAEPFIQAILKHYTIKEGIPDNMDIVLSI